MGLMRRQSGDRGVAPALACAAAGLSCLPPAQAAAQSGNTQPPTIESDIAGALDIIGDRFVESFSHVPQEVLAALSLFLGILFFAVLAAILYVRTRARLQLVEREAREELGELSARVERAEGLLAVDQTVLVVWPAGSDLETVEVPEIDCASGPSRVLPSRRSDVLAFGKWLDAESAFELERLIVALRARGEGFNVMLRTRARRDTAVGYVEADGRSVGGRAVLRLRDLSAQRRETAEVLERNKNLSRQLEGLRSLMDALPMPIWLSNGSGKLIWTNPAYARAVGAESVGDAVTAGTPLYEGAARDRLVQTGSDAGVVHGQIPLKVGGEDRAHEVWEVSGDRYAAGIAMDIAETDRLRRQIDTRDSVHARTLDQMPSAVAVFGGDRRLVFNNRTFRQLWGLDARFLESRPGFDEILDRLRAAGRLQEPVDYRGWRDDQLAIFDATGETEGGGQPMRQTVWYLPDGRAFRVALARRTDGLVSALFEDVTASIDLESRFVALTLVQRETIDSLDEGIAVFGTDGRLKLHNPAFADLWKLSADKFEKDPHVEDVVAWCRDLYGDEMVWGRLRAIVTSLLDSRESLAVRMERPDRTIIDLRAVPLPDGATLAVFTDVSDTARIEKALRDRNEALMTAARIKSEFVHKVSYELRAPLTNIIGFAELMNNGESAEMSERQREYAGYVLSSSKALEAIINDILDLQTIDAGVMELEWGDVDIAAAVAAAVDGLRDRMKESGIALQADVPAGMGTFEADEKRIRQILFNLLSNAIGFSDPGQTVRIECVRTGDEKRGDDCVVFKVRDEGPGIPDDVRRTVFERFESHSLGTRHRGVGLGLSIVRSFVQLHHGSIELESRPGRGTTVTCSFPAHRAGGEAGPADGEDGFGATVHELSFPQADAAPAALEPVVSPVDIGSAADHPGDQERR